MDNLCHGLAGAALAEAGLKRRTALGYVTLVVGANFPDIDIVAAALGPVASLEHRRGWTHGVLAMVVLPFVLAGLMLAWDRLVRRRRGRGPVEPALPAQLLLLAVISILSHPLLDWMNAYGVRLLMPFSGRWFYGDALFIVDPWLWLVLGAGVVWARRRGRARGNEAGDRAGRTALTIATLYVALMLVSGRAARAIVAREASAVRVADPSAVRLGATPLMVGPVPASPMRRQVVLDAGSRYRVGAFHWLPRPTLALDPIAIPMAADHPLARRAAETPTGRSFLRWARFPFFEVDSASAAGVVRIGDARYTTRARDSWAAVTVPLSR